jgi:hypothetical protein
MATSEPIVLLELPLEFSVQPPSAAPPVGSAVSFVATNVIGNGPFAFQWFFKGEALDEETNAVLTLVALQTSHSGAYSVTVSNRFGAVTNTAMLSVQAFAFDLASTNLYLTADGLHFQLDSVFATNAVVVLASTNLVNWLPILTNPPSTGSVPFIDPEATNLPLRFYRALEQ